MAQQLQIRIGSCLDTLKIVEINSEKPELVENNHFKGRLVVRVSPTGTTTSGPQKHPLKPAYFTGKSRMFSIQFHKAKFKQKWNAADIRWVACFEKPIDPPFGSSIALKFARLIDPSLEADLYSQAPSLGSPLLCAFHELNIRRLAKAATERDLESDLDRYAQWLDAAAREQDDDGVLNLLQENIPENTTILFGKTLSTSQRRNRLKNVKELSKIEIGPDMLISGDFFGPGLDLWTYRINLGIDLGNFERYINGQPIRFMAKSISTGTIFFVVEFDRV